MRKGDVRIIVGVRSMRPSIMHDRPNDVSPRSTSAAILLLNKACVYLCILSNGHSTRPYVTDLLSFAMRTGNMQSCQVEHVKFIES